MSLDSRIHKKPAIVLRNVSKKYNNHVILQDINLTIFLGAKIGIIGRNGAGKSTLLQMLDGTDTEYEGEINVTKDIVIKRLPQEPKFDEEDTVLNNILSGLKKQKELLDAFMALSHQFSNNLTDNEVNQLLIKQSQLQTEIDKSGAWNLEQDVQKAMTALKCPLPDTLVKYASGGEKRRIALCRLLLESHDILILDEPTNHLDLEGVLWLQRYLSEYKGTILLITHDRYFLDKISNWILEIEHGKCIPWHANYSAWLEKKEIQLATTSKTESALRKQIKRELEWKNASAKGRQSKNKARIKSYDELVHKYQSLKSSQKQQIIIPPGERLGDLVLEVSNIYKKFQDKILMQDFSFRIMPGTVVGLIGPNGMGKTTLFKMIAGLEGIDQGNIKLGQTVQLGYVNQERNALNDESNVWAEITNGKSEIEMGSITVDSRAYVAAFNFKGTNQQKKVGNLSGGERNRVHLAKLLTTKANFLLLDEPTNDLDIETRRALEDAILNFPGCVMVITHDRWFIDRVATHIIAFEKGKSPIWFEGNYHDYQMYISNKKD